MCLVFQVVLGQLFFQGGCGVEVNHEVCVCVSDVLGGTWTAVLPGWMWC